MEEGMEREREKESNKGHAVLMQSKPASIRRMTGLRE